MQAYEPCQVCISEIVFCQKSEMKDTIMPGERKVLYFRPENGPDAPGTRMLA
jgi:hypothetical protein